jgi:hypothetical protein
MHYLQVVKVGGLAMGDCSQVIRMGTHFTAIANSVLYSIAKSIVKLYYKP